MIFLTEVWLCWCLSLNYCQRGKNRKKTPEDPYETTNKLKKILCSYGKKVKRDLVSCSGSIYLKNGALLELGADGGKSSPLEGSENIV